MVKREKFFWTPTKIIVTILIVSMLLFILFKVGLFDIISDRFFTASIDSGVSPVGSMVGRGGGIR